MFMPALAYKLNNIHDYIKTILYKEDFNLKNSLSKFKWLINHTKPFIIPLSAIILLGGTSSILGIYRVLISKALIDAATHAETGKMLNTLIIFAIFIAIEILIQTITSKLSVKSYLEICNNIQKNFYKKIMYAKWAPFNKYHSGDILTRLTSDADAVTNLLINVIPNMITNIVLLLGSFLMLLYFNSTLAIIAFLFSPLPLIISKFYSTKLKKIYKKLQQKESQYRSFLHESIQNITIVKAFSLENTNLIQINTIQKEKLDLTLSKNNLTIISNTIFSLSSWFIFFLVYTWGVTKLSKGTITFGTITALLQLINNIKDPFSNIATSIPKIGSTLASAERLIEIEDLESDIFDTTGTYMDKAGIEFNNVSFSYENSNSILKDINLTINPNQTVALIGSSGEGKTTLIRILLSLTYPTTGKIFLTNKIGKLDVTATTRRMISYVPQGNTLFSGTIYDNVKFGNLDATEEDIKAALRAACALDFIDILPNGLNCVIGEGGQGLSEGQAQRISIARALIKKAPILILDEATSALDSDTEINVLKSIKNLNPTPTCLIITHRHTALKICNRVLKLDNGRIIEVENSYYDDAAIELVSGQ
jgi:ATP-binding cassette subfamily B protein